MRAVFIYCVWHEMGAAGRRRGRGGQRVTNVWEATGEPSVD